MAEIRRNRRLIESVDPVTGARTYIDELTGEVVAQDQVAQYTVVQPPATEATETVVTERLTPGQTYVTREPTVPASQPVVTQRTVRETVAPVAPVVTQQTVYTDALPTRVTTITRVQQIIYLVFSIIEALLAIRFILMLLGANPQAGFAALIYGLTAPFLLPFAGLFGQPAAGGSVIETNTIVALVVYPLLAWALARGARLLAQREVVG